MTTITIPNKNTKANELVVIPLEEYEGLLQLRKIYEFQPTKAQKKALEQSRKNRKQGRTMTLYELERKLGFGN